MKLDQARKLILINSIIVVMASHVMAMYLVPKSVLKKNQLSYAQVLVAFFHGQETYLLEEAVSTSVPQVRRRTRDEKSPLPQLTKL